MTDRNLLIAKVTSATVKAFNNKLLISCCYLRTIFSWFPPTPLRGVYPPPLRFAAPLGLRRYAALDRRAGGVLASTAF